MYDVKWARQGKKDHETAIKNGYRTRTAELLNTVRIDPFDPNPPDHYFEKIKNKKIDIYTRRVNHQHRFVYTVEPNVDNLVDDDGNLFKGIVRVHRMWGHYP